MLQKRRMIASIPDGLCKTTSTIKKGSAVVRKLDSTTGEYVYALPASAEEAKDIYGFITLRIDEDTHKDSYYDTIDSGTRAVVYTLVPNESWGTTEFSGTLAVGDKVMASGVTATAGKLVKVGDNDTAQFEVIATYPAMGGYEEAMIDVRVL